MSFFTDETRSNDQSHFLWAEKYRPNTLDTYICDDNLRNIISDFINRKDIPHILLHGGAGAGKTSLAKIIVKNIPSDCLYVNASDENGIDFVRTKIKGFASSSGFMPLKIVILDESDGLTVEGQSALRNLMETYSQNTRFILTCNYVEKIIKPLISRCQVFNIEPPTQRDVALHIKGILDKEDVKYQISDLKVVLNDFYPDIRKIINYLQQNSTTGVLKIIKSQNASFDLKNKIIEILKNSKTNSNSFNDIRQLVNDAGTKAYDELYSELYSRTKEYAPDKELSVIIDLAEHTFQSSMVVDKEITFMSCIAKIIKTIAK